MVVVHGCPKKLHVVRCGTCGFLALDCDSRTAPDEGKDYYSALPEIAVDPDRRFVRHRVKSIRKHMSSGRCADLGCGLGETAIALARSGFEVEGVEESEHAISYLSANYPEVRWHCERVEPFLERIPERLELVTLYHVLEHVPYAAKVCDQISAVLESGGLLVVEVPNVAGLRARFMRWKWPYWLDHHLNYFDLHSLRGLLESRGFRLIQVERKYHFGYPQGVLWKDIVKAFLARVGFADVICTYWRRC